MTNGVKKRTLTIQELSCELLGLDAGQRLTPIFELAAKLGVSNGTVQNALRLLAEDNAIKLVPRGHMGTFVEWVDYGKLMKHAAIDSVYIAMPIPYTLRYEGLASGLRHELSKLEDSKTGVLFMSGAERRLDALVENRVEAVIMSCLSARRCIKKGLPITVLHRFPKESYINNHYLITRKGFDLEGAGTVRVGIDEKSFDQLLWTDRCFKDRQIERIPVRYLHVLEHIKSGYIDAAVWSFEEKYIDDSFSRIELYDEEMGENTAAALVIRSDDRGVENVLLRNMDFENIVGIQKAVLSGELLADY